MTYKIQVRFCAVYGPTAITWKRPVFLEIKLLWYSGEKKIVHLAGLVLLHFQHLRSRPKTFSRHLVSPISTLMT